MKISDDYVLVSELEKPKPKEGEFETVQVQSGFEYKGKIDQLPSRPAYIGNDQLQVGEVIVFSKYSPDTHEFEGKKLVKITDILAVL